MKKKIFGGALALAIAAPALPLMGLASASPAQAATDQGGCYGTLTEVSTNAKGGFVENATTLSVSARSSLGRWNPDDKTGEFREISVKRGEMTVKVAVSEEAKPGDTYEVEVKAPYYLDIKPGQLEKFPVKDAKGEIIATVKGNGQRGLIFTFTDYVSEHKDTTLSYSVPYFVSNIGRGKQIKSDAHPFLADCHGDPNPKFTAVVDLEQAPVMASTANLLWSGSAVDEFRGEGALLFPVEPEKKYVGTVSPGEGVALDCDGFNKDFRYGIGFFGGNTSKEVGLVEDASTPLKIRTQTNPVAKPGDLNITCEPKKLTYEFIAPTNTTGKDKLVIMSWYKYTSDGKKGDQLPVDPKTGKPTVEVSYKLANDAGRTIFDSVQQASPPAASGEGTGVNKPEPAKPPTTDGGTQTDPEPNKPVEDAGTQTGPEPNKPVEDAGTQTDPEPNKPVADAGTQTDTEPNKPVADDEKDKPGKVEKEKTEEKSKVEKKNTDEKPKAAEKKDKETLAKTGANTTTLLALASGFLGTGAAGVVLRRRFNA